MKDFGKQLTVYHAEKAEAQDKKAKAKRNVLVCGVVAVIAFILKFYIYGCICIAMTGVCLFYSSQPSKLQSQLEIWENGYVLKMNDGKVYRVKYEEASVPSVYEVGNSVIVKLWDSEAKKHSHLFEVESVEKGREICEMIDETAKKMGITIS